MNFDDRGNLTDICNGTREAVFLCGLVIYTDFNAVDPVCGTERSGFPYVTPDGAAQEAPPTSHAPQAKAFILGHPCALSSTLQHPSRKWGVVSLDSALPQI